MVKLTVKIVSMQDADKFNKLCSKFDCDMDLQSGKYYVDAKSIMGIFSLDLSKPLILNADTDDEELIKENVNALVKKVVPDEFMTLNYERLDGLTTTFNDIENACETMPFFGEKKAIVVYRANFLKDKTDKEGAKLYSEISEYVKNLPPYAVLIMYYLFNDKRDTPKKNKKLGTLDKYIKVVHCDKLKKDKYYKKIEDIFKENGKNIGKIQVRYFGEKVQNNFDIINKKQ